MANVWAIKSGDWSDTTVWNTGALPTSADDVYANNFNVNVNQNINVTSLRNTTIVGNNGGTFTFNIGDVTANISNNLFITNTTQFIIVTASNGKVIINVPNNIIFNSGAGNNSAINHTGNCDLEINSIRLQNGGGSGSRLINKSSIGNLYLNCELLGGNNNGGAGSVLIQSTGNTIINGNVIGGSGGNAGSKAIEITGGNLTINGYVKGGNLSTYNLGGIAIWSSTEGNINITGDISGIGARAIYASKGMINITGMILGTNLSGIATVEILGTATLNHIGTAQASASASAIKCDTPTTSTVTCTGPFLKNGNIVAIASQTLRINFNSNSYFQFKKSNGDDIDYVSTVEGYNYPLASDVRYGVEYKSGLAIGTCHVPTPDNVRKNIPVDNTVGTSDNVNAEGILEAIQNSSLPIAERLRNVATVESTGAQITSYG